MRRSLAVAEGLLKRTRVRFAYRLGLRPLACARGVLRLAKVHWTFAYANAYRLSTHSSPPTAASRAAADSMGPAAERFHRRRRRNAPGRSRSTPRLPYRQRPPDNRPR